MSATADIDKSVIISQLIASINQGDGILIRAGWDLVAGPYRPCKSDTCGTI